MAITYEFKKRRVEVTQDFPKFPNLIVRVEWEIEFTDGTNYSSGLGVTDLDISSISDFTAIEQVTDAMLEDWVIQESFHNNWNDFVAHHEKVITDKKELPNLEVYYTNGEPSLTEGPNLEELEAEALEKLKERLIKLGIAVN